MFKEPLFSREVDVEVVVNLLDFKSDGGWSVACRSLLSFVFLDKKFLPRRNTAGGIPATE